MIYERRFGLEKNPFRMTPDPSFLFLTPMHREALSGLLCSILENRGFVVLTGEAGTGKTTLLSHILRYLSKDRVNFSLIVNPTLSPAEFLEAALVDFGITDIPASKVQRLRILQQFITEGHLKGRTSVLVVDEAQKLSAEVLEEIRLLTNFETADQKLLQIVLVGQGELKQILGLPDLRQLKQRIAARFELQPLESSEVFQYMQFRWNAAGGNTPVPFAPATIGRIARASSGIPRLINAICDNALLLVFATESDTVELEHIDQVLTDLDLEDPDAVYVAAASLDGQASSAERGVLHGSGGQPPAVADEMRLKLPQVPVDPALSQPAYRRQAASQPAGWGLGPLQRAPLGSASVQQTHYSHPEAQYAPPADSAVHPGAAEVSNVPPATAQSPTVHARTTQLSLPVTTQPAIVRPAAAQMPIARPLIPLPAMAQSATVQTATAQPATVQTATAQQAAPRQAALQQAALHQAALHQARLNHAALHQATLHQAALHQATLHQTAVQPAEREQAPHRPAPRQPAALQHGPTLHLSLQQPPQPEPAIQEMKLNLPTPGTTRAAAGYPIRIRTLERYDNTLDSSPPSLWMRWAGRLGF